MIAGLGKVLLVLLEYFKQTKAIQISDRCFGFNFQAAELIVTNLDNYHSTMKDVRDYLERRLEVCTCNSFLLLIVSYILCYSHPVLTFQLQINLFKCFLCHWWKKFLFSFCSS